MCHYLILSLLTHTHRASFEINGTSWHHTCADTLSYVVPLRRKRCQDESSPVIFRFKTWPRLRCSWILCGNICDRVNMHSFTCKSENNWCTGWIRCVTVRRWRWWSSSFNTAAVETPSLSITPPSSLTSSFSPLLPPRQLSCGMSWTWGE